MGVLRLAQGKPAAAEALYLQAIKNLEEEKKKDEVTIASMHDSLCESLRRQSKHAEAEKAGLFALEIRERRFGADHLQVASSLLTLGNL